MGLVHSNPHDTELEAAEAIKPHVGRLQRLAAQALLHRSMTDFELAAHTGLRHNTIAPRRVELTRKGFVRKTTERRPTGQGGNAIVWELTSEGRAFLQETA